MDSKEENEKEKEKQAAERQRLERVYDTEKEFLGDGVVICKQTREQIDKEIQTAMQQLKNLGEVFNAGRYAAKTSSFAETKPADSASEMSKVEQLVSEFEKRAALPAIAGLPVSVRLAMLLGQLDAKSSGYQTYSPVSALAYTTGTGSPSAITTVSDSCYQASASK